MSYATLADLKATLRIEENDDDDQLELALDAAAGQIDEFCRRTFTKVDPDTDATSQRVYNPSNRVRLFIDDAVAVDKVEHRGSTTSDYEEIPTSDWGLEPSNAAVEGRPYTRLVTLRGRLLHTGFESVRITGWFGWPATPDQVVKANLLQAARLFARRDSAQGVIGVALSTVDTGGMRVLPKMDADAELMVAPFRRDPVLV